MQHKKQFYEQLLSVYKWNEFRGNTPNTFKKSLEVKMISEELKEYLDALTEVDQLDALMDMQFVIHGTLYKMGLSPQQVVDSYQAVINANNTKSAEKNEDGKIMKSANFEGPEGKLQAILDERT